jgi:hypothetical protein
VLFRSITIDDLRQFKTELLSDLRTLLCEQNNQVPQKEWLKSSEVRKLLKISPGTLQNLRVNGTLSFTKIGGIIFYSYAEIDKIINGNQINNLKQGSFKHHKDKAAL